MLISDLIFPILDVRLSSAVLPVLLGGLELLRHADGEVRLAPRRPEVPELRDGPLKESDDAGAVVDTVALVVEQGLDAGAFLKFAVRKKQRRLILNCRACWETILTCSMSGGSSDTFPGLQGLCPKNSRSSAPCSGSGSG